MAITVNANINPIQITGTTDADTEVVPSNKSVFIKHIVWYKPTTIGHLLSLKDKSGNVIAAGYCEAADQTVYIPVFIEVSGVRCDDMDSGTVYIYYK
jgi:hypothetical protein